MQYKRERRTCSYQKPWDHELSSSRPRKPQDQPILASSIEEKRSGIASELGILCLLTQLLPPQPSNLEATMSVVAETLVETIVKRAPPWGSTKEQKKNGWVKREFCEVNFFSNLMNQAQSNQVNIKEVGRILEVVFLN